MSKGKACLLRLLFPPGWAVVLLSLLGYGMLIPALRAECPPALTYAAYGLSAYALTVDIAAIPRLKACVKQWAARVRLHSRMLRKLRKTSLGKRLLKDRAFRASVSLYQGMAVNFLYTVFRVVTGTVYSSVWFISIAVYYFLLGALRAYLIFCYRCRPENSLAYEYRCYKNAGRMLLLLNLPMSGMVFLVVFENSGFLYPGVVIYLSALYTFYMAILSIVNLRKMRRLNSPVLEAARLLNFISAAMSVMGLQTAMIARFGQGDSGFRLRINSITGTGVCVLVLGISLYMAVNARKNLREAGEP